MHKIISGRVMAMLTAMVATCAIYCIILIYFYSKSEIVRSTITYTNGLLCKSALLHPTCYHLTYNGIQDHIPMIMLLVPLPLGLLSSIISYRVYIRMFRRKSDVSPVRSSGVSTSSIITILFIGMIILDIFMDYPSLRSIVGGHHQYDLKYVMIHGLAVIAFTHLVTTDRSVTA
jgi:hypothetical protein